MFLEECGQAMEPEALVGVCGVLGSDGQLVLSGDPHQLGPVIRNTLCYSDGFLFRGNGLGSFHQENSQDLLIRDQICIIDIWASSVHIC